MIDEEVHLQVIDTIFSYREGKEDAVNKLISSKEVVEEVKHKISYLVGCIVNDLMKWDSNNIDSYLITHSDFILSVAKSSVLHVAVSIFDEKKDKEIIKNNH